MPDLPTAARDMAEALRECADELEAVVEHHYAVLKDHPAMTPKYERDMEPVLKARAALARYDALEREQRR